MTAEHRISRWVDRMAAAGLTEPRCDSECGLAMGGGRPRSAASRWEAAANPWLGAIVRCSRTGSSNPSPSSGESRELQYRNGPYRRPAGQAAIRGLTVREAVRTNRQARRGSDGKLCSLCAIIVPPLDGKKKYTQIIVS